MVLKHLRSFQAMRRTLEQRTILKTYILEQAVQYGTRCPATQEELTSRTSVLVKRHSPTSKCGETWVVVSGYAYDCAVAQGVLRIMERESVYWLEVIDGRAC